MNSLFNLNIVSQEKQRKERKEKPNSSLGFQKGFCQKKKKNVQWVRVLTEGEKESQENFIIFLN